MITCSCKYCRLDDFQLLIRLQESAHRHSGTPHPKKAGCTYTRTHTKRFSTLQAHRTHRYMTATYTKKDLPSSSERQDHPTLQVIAQDHASTHTHACTKRVAPCLKVQRIQERTNREDIVTKLHLLPQRRNSPAQHVVRPRPYGPVGVLEPILPAEATSNPRRKSPIPTTNSIRCHTCVIPHR